MGAGIAEVSMKKFDVLLKDTSQDGIARGIKQIEKSYNGKVKRKQMTEFEKTQAIGMVKTTDQWENFDKADIVIEAVFEDLGVKHKVLKELETKISKDCIFASNTSAIPIGDIAKGSSRPENVLGMHYFSP